MEPRDWSAERWAKWALSFVGEGRTIYMCGCMFNSPTANHFSADPMGTWCKTEGGGHLKEFFNPLHDANHMMLVLNEIERRGLSWKWDYDDWFEDRKTTFQSWPKGKCSSAKSGAADSRNLAVLLAAHAV